MPRSVLNTIAAKRAQRVGEIRQQLAERLARHGMECGCARLEENDLEGLELPRSRPRHSLRESIAARQRRALIMECKASSPSKGTIRAAYDPAELARIYAPYATGISVLCEPDYFSGSFDHLEAVAKAVDLPILAKDFTIDRAQIALSHMCGADAVLLMLSLLDDDAYRHLAAYAKALGMDIVTEVLTEDEARRAASLGADMVDVNHRNLHTLEIDTQRCRNLAPLLGEETAVIAASGMSSLADTSALDDVADAFLVGSALSGCDDVESAVRRLVYGTVKVCGITDEKAARACEASGVSFGGINCVESSPRYVSLPEAAAIVEAAPSLEFVAVTLAESESDLARACEYVCQLDMFGLQLHGPLATLDGEAALIESARKRLGPQAAIIRAVPHSVPGDILNFLLSHQDIHAVIVDSPRAGSGATWNWGALPAHARSHVWVAGGIGADNAIEAFQAGFGGIDANSAVEKPREQGARAYKDPDEIIRMMNNLSGRK